MTFREFVRNVLIGIGWVIGGAFAWYVLAPACARVFHLVF